MLLQLQVSRGQINFSYYELEELLYDTKLEYTYILKALSTYHLSSKFWLNQ